MLVLLGAALLALTTARCNCGPEQYQDVDCQNPGEFRCYNGTDPAISHPHGSVFQRCKDLGSGIKLWFSEYCDAEAFCPAGTVCVDYDCYCTPAH